MDLPLWMEIFVVSIFTLITAARFFTQSAEIIGLTWTLGMSSLPWQLPELISSIIAIYGNGSWKYNWFKYFKSVSGIRLNDSRVRLGDKYIFIDLHFLVGSAFLLVIMMWDGLVRPMEGAILLAGYVIYVIYLLQEETPRKIWSYKKKFRRQLPGK